MKHLLPHTWRQALKRRLFAVRDMSTRLETLRGAGFRCNGAIDAGSYRGDWTREFWAVFPQVPVLMVEPQPLPQPQLRHLAASVAGSEVIAAALTDRIGSATLALHESNSGLRVGPSPTEETILVPCTTLAAILQERERFAPNLLKLDLQGHELKALRGAGDQLSRFEVIICELSLIPIGAVPIFAEMQRFFEEQGYRLYDVLPQYDRPLDGALWQLDAFYVRSYSDLIASTAWG
jgi:FkbM family methyltransferase